MQVEVINPKPANGLEGGRDSIRDIVIFKIEEQRQRCEFSADFFNPGNAVITEELKAEFDAASCNGAEVTGKFAGERKSGVSSAQKIFVMMVYPVKAAEFGLKLAYLVPEAAPGSILFQDARYPALQAAVSAVMGSHSATRSARPR